MSAFHASRARALALLFVVSILSGQADAAADVRDALTATGPAPVAASALEPFGLSIAMLPDSPLRSKWHDVERAIADDVRIIAECERIPAACTSLPAQRFLAIVKAASARDGLARLGEINRAFNLAIRPVSDSVQYGVEDHWSSPLATLASGAGDCEDYAIAKMVALRAAGVAAEDLRLVIIRETVSGEDHAVVAARTGGQWRMLDNRNFLMLEDGNFAKYRPLFAIDAEGAKRFEQPVFAVAPRETEARPADIAAPAPDEFSPTLAL